ncbi:uncharacterized protein C8Q71DRAFT_500182 [Rhodofomes roseus]|uniref:Secreted protein n=1 Tax=Rhodofomes roseus TaxID=34475 RepID=A0ABQ8KLT8_9APHY|nr:uncharacterized protein C8Q71DRAFT_500182 [Rhodofomes roseus]KAH9839171.1 hypothetical protein C8Q71DRAFT_500182 [Rhodofomes roseus]
MFNIVVSISVLSRPHSLYASIPIQSMLKRLVLGLAASTSPSSRNVYHTGSGEWVSFDLGFWSGFGGLGSVSFFAAPKGCCPLTLVPRGCVWCRPCAERLREAIMVLGLHLCLGSRSSPVSPHHPCVDPPSCPHTSAPVFVVRNPVMPVQSVPLTVQTRSSRGVSAVSGSDRQWYSHLLLLLQGARQHK